MLMVLADASSVQLSMYYLQNRRRVLMMWCLGTSFGIALRLRGSARGTCIFWVGGLHFSVLDARDSSSGPILGNCDLEEVVVRPWDGRCSTAAGGAFTRSS
jgi:hypothetical protein